MVMIQDQAEKLLKPFIDNSPGINDESKKMIDQWTSDYKQRRDSFKKTVETGYDNASAKMEEFFDCNAILRFQEQNEKMFSTFMNQAGWMPPDYKKAAEDLSAIYKKCCEEYKKYVEEKVNHMGDCFSEPGKKETKTGKRK